MIIFCMGVAGFSGYKILSKMMEYRRGDNTYQDLEKHIDTDSGGDVVTVRLHTRSKDGEPGAGTRAAAAESTAAPDGTDAAGTQNQEDGSGTGASPSGPAAGGTGELPADPAGESPGTYEGGPEAAAAPEEGTMSGQGGEREKETFCLLRQC